MAKRRDPFATTWRPPSAPLLGDDPPPPRRRRRLARAAALVAGILALAALVGSRPPAPPEPAEPTLPAVDLRVAGPPADVPADATAPTVTLDRCATDALGFVEASGTITNRSSSTAGFSVHVVFEHGDLRVGDGLDVVVDLEPGRVATWRVVSMPDLPDGVTCRVQRAGTFP